MLAARRDMSWLSVFEYMDTLQNLNLTYWSLNRNLNTQGRGTLTRRQVTIRRMDQSSILRLGVTRRTTLDPCIDDNKLIDQCMGVILVQVHHKPAHWWDFPHVAANLENLDVGLIPIKLACSLHLRTTQRKRHNRGVTLGFWLSPVVDHCQTKSTPLVSLTHEGS